VPSATYIDPQGTSHTLDGDDGVSLMDLAVKNGVPGTYTVWLATDSSHCNPAGMLITNDQGNGNAHLDSAGTSGSYYVVLQDSNGQEAYASAPVDAN